MKVSNLSKQKLRSLTGNPYSNIKCYQASSRHFPNSKNVDTSYVYLPKQKSQLIATGSFDPPIPKNVSIADVSTETESSVNKEPCHAFNNDIDPIVEEEIESYEPSPFGAGEAGSDYMLSKDEKNKSNFLTSISSKSTLVVCKCIEPQVLNDLTTKLQKIETIIYDYISSDKDLTVTKSPSSTKTYKHFNGDTRSLDSCTCLSSKPSSEKCSSRDNSCCGRKKRKKPNAQPFTCCPWGRTSKSKDKGSSRKGCCNCGKSRKSKKCENQKRVHVLTKPPEIKQSSTSIHKGRNCQSPRQAPPQQTIPVYNVQTAAGVEALSSTKKCSCGGGVTNTNTVVFPPSILDKINKLKDSSDLDISKKVTSIANELENQRRDLGELKKMMDNCMSMLRTGSHPRPYHASSMQTPFKSKEDIHPLHESSFANFEKPTSKSKGSIFSRLGSKLKSKTRSKSKSQTIAPQESVMSKPSEPHIEATPPPPPLRKKKHKSWSCRECFKRKKKKIAAKT